jgi:predicted acylesterase/phospholipase RssA
MKDLREPLVHPAIVLLHAEGDLAQWLPQLSELLAQTLRRDFGEPVLVAGVLGSEQGGEQAGAPPDPSGQEDQAPKGPSDLIFTDELGIARTTLAPPGEGIAAMDALRVSLAESGRRYAHTVVDTSSRGPAFTKAFAEMLGSADTGDLAGRLVVLGRDRASPPPMGAWRILRTDVLAPGRAAPGGGTRDQLRRAGAIGSLEWNRLTRRAQEQRGEAYPLERVDPEWCRFVLDPAWLRVSPLRIDRLPPEAQRSFSRWARAITGRRVGLALGGSGAFGFAHVALINALEDRGVPIDLVAGSSSGSLMGAYYCALGRAGLDRLVELRDTLQLYAGLSMISSAAIELRVDLDLGPVQLDDLEIPLLPVATNLTSGEAEIIRRASVGFGVRASGTAPGLFGSTLARNAVYVDGAITDNVPVLLARNEGAALVIAANPVPPPPGLHVDTPRNAILAFLEELSPARRAVDLFSSLSLLVHAIGDLDARDAPIYYDPPPEQFALFKTFEFARAREIMAHVEQQPEFQRTIDAAERAWRSLSAPRTIGVAP